MIRLDDHGDLVRPPVRVEPWESIPHDRCLTTADDGDDRVAVDRVEDFEIGRDRIERGHIEPTAPRTNATGGREAAGETPPFVAAGHALGHALDREVWEVRHPYCHVRAPGVRRLLGALQQ